MIEKKGQRNATRANRQAPAHDSLAPIVLITWTIGVIIGKSRQIMTKGWWTNTAIDQKKNRSTLSDPVCNPCKKKQGNYRNKNKRPPCVANGNGSTLLWSMLLHIKEGRSHAVIERKADSSCVQRRE